MYIITLYFVSNTQCVEECINKYILFSNIWGENEATIFNKIPKMVKKNTHIKPFSKL